VASGDFGATFGHPGFEPGAHVIAIAHRITLQSRRRYGSPLDKF
jgi:hypothetical protein